MGEFTYEHRTRNLKGSRRQDCHRKGNHPQPDRPVILTIRAENLLTLPTRRSQVDGELWDLERPFEKSAKLELFDFESPEGETHQPLAPG